ncbi:hypothetical protein KNP414_03430 [Paenibacillus mucilaginosus KNP414]|uniref:Uncharacterized protein n=2 Tax=Paenibacillus mucilaginosus TaxID=61624 RepID=F8F8S6_PAEMK|nr:hypothetical protein KNP414_03430 [Paenibacillus mucilaginosus KNP414]
MKTFPELDKLLWKSEVISMEGGYPFPELIWLRPVHMTLGMSLVFVLLTVVFQKVRLFNLFSVTVISMLCSVVSAVTLYASGYIVDEYLGGDEVSFFMFLANLGLSVLNMMIYWGRNSILTYETVNPKK